MQILQCPPSFESFGYRMIGFALVIFLAFQTLIEAMKYCCSLKFVNCSIYLFGYSGRLDRSLFKTCNLFQLFVQQRDKKVHFPTNVFRTEIQIRMNQVYTKHSTLLHPVTKVSTCFSLYEVKIYFTVSRVGEGQLTFDNWTMFSYPFDTNYV